MEFHQSACKHDETEESIRHALDNALVVADLEPDEDPPRVLAIGRDAAGNLPEVIWLQFDDGPELVIHAMRLRRTFFDLLPGDLP